MKVITTTTRIWGDLTPQEKKWLDDYLVKISVPPSRVTMASYVTNLVRQDMADNGYVKDAPCKKRK